MSSTPPPALYPWPSSVRPSQREGTNLAWLRNLVDDGLLPPGAVEAAMFAATSSSSSPTPFGSTAEEQQERVSPSSADQSAATFTGRRMAVEQHFSSFTSTETAGTTVARPQSSIQVDADWAMSARQKHDALVTAEARRCDHRQLNSSEFAPELVAAQQHQQPASPPSRLETCAQGQVQWSKRFPAPSSGPLRPLPSHITVDSYGGEVRDANVGTPTGLVSSYAHHASGALPAEQPPTEYPCPYSHRSSACRPPGSTPYHDTASHGFAAGSMVPAGSPSATAHRAAHAYVPRYPEESHPTPRYPPMAYTNTMSTSTIDYSSTHDHGDVDLTSSLRHHHRGGQVDYDAYQDGRGTVAAPTPMATTSRAPMMDTEMPSPSHHHHHPYPPSSSRMLTSTHRWYSHEQAASYEDQPPPYTDYSQQPRSLSRRPSLGAIHFETRRASTTANDHPFYWQGELDRQVPYYTSIERGRRE